MSNARYVVGDVFDRMVDIPDGSVDLIVTSPPFLALRSYLPADHPDKAKEIGSEPTPAAFLSTLLALTREWRRILAPHGSLCVELGDTYSDSGGAGGDYNAGGMRDLQPRFAGSGSKHRMESAKPGTNSRLAAGTGWPLDKSLCLIPSSYAFALAYGHNPHNPDDRIEPMRVRNLIVWHRPNPPVSALGDKVRPSTSYVTVACTAKDRWFDLDSERGAGSPNTHARLAKGAEPRPANGKKAANPNNNFGSMDEIETNGAPPLDCWFDTTTEDVWTIPTAPYKGSHYATFPPALPRKLINLMCPRQVCTVCGEPRRRITESLNSIQDDPAERHDESQRKANSTSVNTWKQRTGAICAERETLGWSDCGCAPTVYARWRRGIVLDPFAGSGTTLQAASELGRDSIGIDLDPRNLELARERVGMFLEVEEMA